MESKPLVSIGIPSYNCEDKIKNVLNFFLKQSYQNIEIIISDNFSTDKTLEIIQQGYGNNNKIKLYNQITNIGASKNFNFVLEKSTGKYFMWASYDDEWNMDYIKNGVEELEKNEEYITVTGITKIYDKKNKLRVKYSEYYELNGSKQNRLKNFLRYNYGDHLIYGIHRLKIIKNIKFKTNYFSPEIYFLFNILCQGKIIGSRLLEFTKHEEFNYSKKQLKYIRGSNRKRQAQQYKLKENFYTRHGMMLTIIIKIILNFNVLTSLSLILQIILFKNPILRLIKIYPQNSKNTIEFN